MVREINEWLENPGLAKYTKAFAENEVDFAGIEIALVSGDSNVWTVE